MIEPILWFLVAVTLLSVFAWQHRRRHSTPQITVATDLVDQEETKSAVRRELARAAHQRSGLVIGLLHLDGAVEEGEAKLAADLLAKVIREGDTVARVLPHRFLLVLPVVQAKIGKDIAETLMARFHKLSAKKKWTLEPSAGLLFLPRPKALDDVNQILRAAENLVCEVAGATDRSYLLRGWI